MPPSPVSVPARVDVPDDITIAITSCNRPDLLSRTLASFKTYHSGGKYLISEDSGLDEAVQWLRREVPEATILPGNRAGLMGSIDRLYAAVTTPYVFHLEDDWGFDGPVDFEAARAILRDDPRVSVACVRAFDELKRRHLSQSVARRVGTREVRTFPTGIHPQWYGYTSNPGLLRRDFWEAFAPFGRFQHDQFSQHVKEAGYRVDYILPGVARHIGQGRHVADPTMPDKRKPASAFRRFRWRLKQLVLGR